MCKEQFYKTPTRVIEQWESDTNESLDEWKSLLASNYHLTKETKIQTFIFKLFHRILPTAEFLHKVGLSDSDTCRLCEENVETLIHYMCSCPVIVRFWQEVKDWMFTNLDSHVPINMHNLVFGWKLKTQENYVILIGKYYLYLCKHKSQFPQLNEFIVVLKHHSKIENLINPKHRAAGASCGITGVRLVT